LNLKGLKPEYVAIDLRTEEHLKGSLELSQWPLIASIETACMQLDAFKDAAPMQQIDAS
jgi:hypothetical protein